MFQAQSRTQGARSFAEATGTDRQAIEDVAREQYGPAEYAAEVAAAGGEALSETVTEAAEEAAEPLLDVFRFTGEQRATLQTLRGNIETAENDIRNLTEDSTQEEVITAYQNLAAAEQAYTQRQLEFIDAGTQVSTQMQHCKRHAILQQQT